MNIRVLDGSGREVDPYSINWNRYGNGRLPPYQFRQDPGPNNALGLVKIMFPNPYLVYLHDSPAKSLYEQDARAFSSGCIRVQKPFELAELVLNDPQWTQQTMADVIASKQTRTVNLKKPVPVLILYWTAQPRPDGQIIFRNDVYGRDPQTSRRSTASSACRRDPDPRAGPSMQPSTISAGRTRRARHSASAVVVVTARAVHVTVLEFFLRGFANVGDLDIEVQVFARPAGDSRRP